MIASVSTFLYMSFWLCVLDKANNSLRYVHVSCDKRLLLCYLMLRAAASCCRLHRSSQQHLYKLACNHRLMTILTYTWTEKWWQFAVEKCEEWTDGRIVIRGKNNGGACCCLTLGIWRYIAFYLVNYDIALISFANTTIPCSVLISLLDVKKYKCWLNLMWYSTLNSYTYMITTSRHLQKVCLSKARTLQTTYVRERLMVGQRRRQYARFYSKLIDKVMWYKQRWCIVKYIIYLFIESWESCVL